MLRNSDIAHLDDIELAEANINTTSLCNTIQQEIYKRATEKKFDTLLDELDETQEELRIIRRSLNQGCGSSADSSESSDNHNTPPRDPSSSRHPLLSGPPSPTNQDLDPSPPNIIDVQNPPSIVTSSNATSIITSSNATSATKSTTPKLTPKKNKKPTKVKTNKRTSNSARRLRSTKP